MTTKMTDETERKLWRMHDMMIDYEQKYRNKAKYWRLQMESCGEDRAFYKVCCAQANKCDSVAGAYAICASMLESL